MTSWALQNAIATRNCKTQLQHTSAKHICKKHVQNTQLQSTIAKHNRKTQSQNTIAKHNRNTQLRHSIAKQQLLNNNCNTTLAKRKWKNNKCLSIFWKHVRGAPTRSTNSKTLRKCIWREVGGTPRGEHNGIASKAIKNPYRLRLPLGKYINICWAKTHGFSFSFATKNRPPTEWKIIKYVCLFFLVFSPRARWNV